MDFHLAQINISRLIAPTDDPRIADFVEQLEPINALAESSPGFVWRLQSASGNATDIAYGEDPLVIVNMSVWESIDALRDYAYGSKHIEVFRTRAKWFEKLDKPSLCMWWIPIGHEPTVAEGRERLTHFQENGASPYAFSFSQRFVAEHDAPIDSRRQVANLPR